MKIRSNSKYLKDIKENATNIIYHGQTNKPASRDSLKSAMIYIGCGFDHLIYKGEGQYSLCLTYGSYSFDSIKVADWEGK